MKFQRPYRVTNKSRTSFKNTSTGLKALKESGRVTEVLKHVLKNLKLEEVCKS